MHLVDLNAFLTLWIVVESKIYSMFEYPKTLLT